MFHDGVYGSQGLCTSNSYSAVKNIWCVGKKPWDFQVGYSITAVQWCRNTRRSIHGRRFKTYVENASEGG